ncbi:MAG: hypothetical protein GX811_02515 [Lentisphaerae bacterium]|jgi:hypothetical protein|nr:hypothetical protein [Lentisphaerota bacterium]
MVKSRLSSNDAKSLRSKIFKLVNDADAPAAEVISALAQCQAHIQNRMIVEQTLKECGFRPTGFNANEHLELYYDIAQGKNEVGYISKGWDDPGFRVGDVIEVSKWKITALKEHAYTLLKYCATRGVVMTVEENDDDSVMLQMDSVIYSDGFNKKVFAQVIHYLNECTTKAEQLFG